MPASRELPWDKSLQLLLVGIVVFNAIPHYFDIPMWASALAAVLLFWKFMYLHRGLWRPPKQVIWGIALLASGCVVLEYRTLIGQDAAASLLVILASCKLLETNRYRDAMFVVFTSYFLLMTHLLFSQSLLSTVFMAIDVLLITTLMFHIHKRDRRTSARSFRPIMRTMLLALPVWIFLFIAFPRFSAGFWNMKTDPKNNIGFSESLDPGGVSEIAGSEETAFRVDFNDGVRPNPEFMYWRGAILTVGDGLKWKIDRAQNTDRIIQEKPTEKPIQYEVLLEPTFRRWLFVLDYPGDIQISPKLSRLFIRRKQGFIFESGRELMSRISYQGTAHLRAERQTLSLDEKQALLELPELDPRVSNIVAKIDNDAKLRPRGTRAEKISSAALKYFAEQKFRYTLKPGPLAGRDGATQLAEFLFTTKRGFCEHYAAAFATLMRASGIPSRVVLGYQGGKENEFGDYLLVRQMDAHAWSEVWDDEASRWFRVDPTSVIAPLRLRIGGDYNLLEEEQIAQNMSEEEVRRRLNGGFGRFGIRLALAWDAVQMKWNAFLNDYDFEFQQSLLARIGLHGVARWMLFIGVAIVMTAFV
ncbi:MAG TPA: DUF3488 and transglutaminase-like domain-containing protein, partial [Bdellovibrionales bacterium]|nr:DUF3488 and transglutaminase-like domain-containing protein [Bdellovibrionales bacterium]